MPDGCEQAEVVRKEFSDVLPHLCAFEEFLFPGAEVESVLCGWGVEFESEVVTGEKEAGCQRRLGFRLSAVIQIPGRRRTEGVHVEQAKDLFLLFEDFKESRPANVECLQGHDLFQESAVGLGVDAVRRDVEREGLLDGA